MLVEIGVVGRPHGVNGEICIFLHNPESSTLERLDIVHVVNGTDVRRFGIASLRAGRPCVYARLDGVSTRSEAEMLKGARICVLRSELPALEPDEIYVADLVGLDAWEGSTRLGVVASSRPQGDIEVVAISGDRDELEIPLVEDYVEEIDIPNRRILFKDTGDLPRHGIGMKIGHGKK